MQWWCHRCRGALAQLQHRPHTLGSRGRYPTSTRSSNPPPTDNADSAGLLVSHAAGATWSSLRDGLQTDDGPYHKVLSLSVPPNFGTDQTLYFTRARSLATRCGGNAVPWVPNANLRHVRKQRWRRVLAGVRPATRSRLHARSDAERDVHDLVAAGPRPTQMGARWPCPPMRAARGSKARQQFHRRRPVQHGVAARADRRTLRISVVH